MNDPRHSFEDADYLYTFERPAPPHVRGDTGQRRVEDERPTIAPERTPLIGVEPTTPVVALPQTEEGPTPVRDERAGKASTPSWRPSPIEREPASGAEERIALSHPSASAPFDPVRFLAEESEHRERSLGERTSESESESGRVPTGAPVCTKGPPIEGVRIEGVEIELEAEPRDRPTVESPNVVGSPRSSESTKTGELTKAGEPTKSGKPTDPREREWVSFVNPPEEGAPPATIEIGPLVPERAAGGDRTQGDTPRSHEVAGAQVAPVPNGPFTEPAPSRTTAEYELAITALRRRGRIRLPVTGESMAPVLVPGDEIEVVSRPARDLELGDIVLFAARDPRGQLVGLVVHRLLLDRPEGLIARGDGARSVDPIWPRDSVLGLVEKRVRRGVAIELSPRRSPIGLGVRRLAWTVRTGWLDSLKSRIGIRRRSRRRGGPRHTVGSAMRSPSMPASRPALDAPRVEVRATAPHGRAERLGRERRPVGGVWRKLRRKLRGRG